MNERIKTLRKSLGLTLEKFGEPLGVTKTTISRLEKGTNNLTEQMLKAICMTYNIREEWLRTGEEPMNKEIGKDEQIKRIVESALTNENEFVRNVLIALMKFSPEEWSKVERFVNQISDDIKNESDNKSYLDPIDAYERTDAKVDDFGNKEIMSKNILRYMEIHKKTRKDMCDALGVKYTTFTDWVKGKSYPRIDKIELMANYFGIKKADLVEERRNNPKKNYTGVTINVLGRVAAGIPIEAIENIIDTEEITETMAKTGTFFGLRIQGDSMEPRIYDGDIVIVRQQDDAESGDIVIAMINGNDATCKRLTKYAGGIALISLNPKYEPMMFNQNDIKKIPIKIIGKVIELRGKL